MIKAYVIFMIVNSLTGQPLQMPQVDPAHPDMVPIDQCDEIIKNKEPETPDAEHKLKIWGCAVPPEGTQV